MVREGKKKRNNRRAKTAVERTKERESDRSEDEMCAEGFKQEGKVDDMEKREQGKEQIWEERRARHTHNTKDFPSLSHC